MVDVFEVARLLVDRTTARHEGEISIVAYYGSRATGTAQSGSDLDIFYIPVEGKSPDAARSFVVDGVTFDFWPITWETAERIAMGAFRSWAVATSIIANSKPLWSGSEEDLARLDTLKARIERLRSEEKRVEMRWRGLTSYPKATLHLEDLRRAVGEGDRSGSRVSAWKLAIAVLDCLALANQVTFDGGWARAIEEADRMAARPDDLSATLREVVTSTDARAALAAAERLYLDARRVLVELREASSPESGADVFRDAFAEFHEHLVKLRRACREGDPLRASLQAYVLHEEMPRDASFPDLPEAFDPEDLGALAAAADRTDERLAGWFEDLGLDRHVFSSVSEVALWLG